MKLSALRRVYTFLQSCVRTVGFELRVSKVQPKCPKVGYETIRTTATYAPWTTDTSFMAVYAVIEAYTLVDRYRCFELWQLVAQSQKVEGALIEIGTWRGGSGALIAASARSVGITDTVYLCDTFTGVVKAGEHDSRYEGGEHADTSTAMVEEVLSALKLDNVTILKGVFPDETATKVSSSSFRFCHVDVDVYESTKDIVAWVWPRLAVGGIMVFDDYGFMSCDGVTRFVNERREHKDVVVIHNLNGHAVLVKI